MKQITQNEFDKVVELHVKWRNDEEGGVRAVLVETDLSEIDFSEANLRGSDLSYSNLSYSNLRGSNLRGSNLSYSNLRGSNLSYSNLRGSNLRGSNLSGSDLSGSNLRYSNLRYSNLVYLRADEYAIYINAKTMQIGCQNHTHEEWFSFDNDDLASMHGSSHGVERWAFWKPVLKTICDQLKANAEAKEAEATTQNS